MILLNVAFMVMIGRLRMPLWVTARWCGVLALSCLLLTFAPVRCLKISFCCGRK